MHLFVAFLLSLGEPQPAAAHTNAPIECTDAIIGGGWAGVYFAYRRAMHAAAKPGSPKFAGICLFEAADRIGGRTYSVPPSKLGNEFTLDVGAYRFSPDMHLPGDLILHDLKLPTACYEPSCPSAKSDFPPPFHFNYTAPLVRIIDPATGLPAGYASALYLMLERIKPLGVRVFMNSALTDISHSGDTSQLIFADGRTATASGAVMLNLPRNKLTLLPSAKTRVTPRTQAMLECIRFDLPKSIFPNTTSMGASTALAKAYLYYSDAWWHTLLNLTSGSFPHNAFHPITTSYGIDIGVHWNDGPVNCTSGASNGGSRSSGTPACHGYLQIYYSATNDTFFYNLSGAPAHPLGIVEAQPPYDHEILMRTHEALLEAITPLLKKFKVLPSAIPPPQQLVVGVWSRPTVIRHDAGFTAPTKVSAR